MSCTVANYESDVSEEGSDITPDYSVLGGRSRATIPYLSEDWSAKNKPCCRLIVRIRLLEPLARARGGKVKVKSTIWKFTEVDK